MNKKVLFDLVCGMELSEFTGDPLTYKHDKKIYYFCSEVCRQHFIADPEKYLVQ